MSMVDVRDVRKVYRRGAEELVVLDGLSLAIEEGDFAALTGPSGSGKTTLLNLIAGIDKPTSGSVVVAGTDVAQLNETGLAEFRSRNVGFIFQFYNLIPVLSATENVELPLLLTHLSKKESGIGLAEVSLQPVVVVLGFAVALFLGFAAGIVPALGAYRARITDMLRTV
jgi:putative ABC transport system ATP-binding protein